MGGACAVVLFALGCVQEDVSLRTEDGVRIAGTYYAAKGRGQDRRRAAAILVPMLLRRRATWSAFAEEAARAGIACIAVDPRGHGDSENPTKQEVLQWGENEWLKVLQDIRAAKEFLKQKGFEDRRIVVIGASIGGSVTLHYGVRDRKIAGIALLSPADNPRRLPIGGLIEDYGERPIFIASSEDDRVYHRIAQRLAGRAKGEKTVRVYSRAGHGTMMFGREDDRGDLTRSLIDWIRRVAGRAE